MREREDWARLDTLLGEVLDRPEGERAAFLDEACALDPERRSRVAKLLELAADTDARLQPGGGLRGPVFEDLALELEAVEAEAALPGANLGRFVVKGVLGEGGMGRVYRALDPGLEREVAIKAVAHDFRDDSGSQRRFEREARVLATLNHPNVGAIYGFELIEGDPYLILELVEGETLAQRLERGALPVGEALAAGVQIADALQEAHRQGIVHRDLKPANIKFAESGRVKVLDFGIAKPLSPPRGAEGEAAGSSDPTTLPGTLLGTAPYMSPEQVRGLPVDTRSDVWSFGCVLYEMLTGRRAFAGQTTSDVLAAVLRDEPDLAALPLETPRGVRRLLRRCLRKDARDRQQDAGDARLELTEAAMDDPPPLAPSKHRPHLAVVLGVLVLFGLLAAAAFRGWTRPGSGARPLLRLALELPANVSLAEGFAAPFELSRDGSKLVFAGRQDGVQQLYVRDVEKLAPELIRGTSDAWQPTFSPDGRALAFFADRKLRVARLGTGEVLSVAEVGGNPRGCAWAAGGAIVIAPAQNAPLFRVDERGAAPVALTRLDESQGEVSHRWPQALPGGFVLFTVALEDRSFDDARIEVVSLETGERKRVLEGGAHGRVLPSGHLVFARGGRLLAVPFDTGRREIRGAPEVVVDGVRYDPQNGGTHFTVSDDGALVYSPGSPTSPERGLAFVSAAGDVHGLLDTPRALREPRLSPDGKRVAVVLAQARGSDLWVVDVASGTLTQLTFGLSPRRPTWTPDGRGITVGVPSGSTWRIVTVPARGGGAGDLLLETPNRAYPNAWSADGKTLVYQERVPGTGWDVFSADLGSTGRLEGTRPLAATPAQEGNAALSPDGHLLAYESDELDAVFEVYVRSPREGAPRVRASTTGGRWPRFAPGGRLFYWATSTPTGLRRIDYAEAAEHFVSREVVSVWGRHADGEAAVSRRVLVNSNDGPYDLDPHGGRFLMLERVGAPEPLFKRPVVVLGFGEGLGSAAR